MIGIDLFAGAGGLSLGARQAGIEIALAVESECHAAATYEANHPETTVFANDVRALTSEELAPWADVSDDLVVFCGAPCQGFSWSNVRTRNQDNVQNWLFEEFLRIVATLRPAWILFENVQGFVTTAKGIFLKAVKNRLEEKYLLYDAVLNAMHFGVPQDRTRFFLVGSRDGLPFHFPVSRESDVVTVDDAICDLPFLRNGATECSLPYGPASPSRYGLALRRGQRECCNHIVTRNSMEVVRRYQHVPPGGNWQDIPPALMSNYRDPSRCHTGLYHRLRSDRASIVIGNFRKNMLIHPRHDRGLSVREAARIQSFPDSYRFCGSIGFQQQQVGNAVPPLLARQVFSSILRSVSR